MFRIFDHIPGTCPLCEGRVTGLRLCAGCLSDLDQAEGRGMPLAESTAQKAVEGAPSCALHVEDTPCEDQHTLRCPRCGLPRMTPAAPCWDCLRNPPPFRRVHVAMPYVSPYDNLVGRLKHRHQLWIAHCLAGLIVRAAGVASYGGVGTDCRGATGRLVGTDVRVVIDRSVGTYRRGAADHPVAADRQASACTPPELLVPDLVVPALLVPIPASRASLKRRGFNPAGEIARALGRRMHMPVHQTLLRRTRDGPKQSELGRQARLLESVDLFTACMPLQGQHVGLVDDVMTTGGTLAAAADALLDQGCAQVTVFVAARTPR